MPSERARSKEDTWTPEELKNSLKGSKKNPYGKSKGRERDRDQRRRDERSRHTTDSTEDRRERRRDETNGTSRRSEGARDDDEDENERMRLREERRKRREGTKDGRSNEDRKEPRRQRDGGSDERREKTRTEDDRGHRRRRDDDARQIEEEDRERQRRERRDKREKKDGSGTRNTENDDSTERKRNTEDVDRRRGKEGEDRHRDDNYDSERDRRRDKDHDGRRRDRDRDDRRQNEESERQQDREERRMRRDEDERKSKDDGRDKDRRKDDRRSKDQRDGEREERKERERKDREKEERRERERKDREKEERRGREEERRNAERERDERGSKGHRSSDKSKEVEKKPSVQESKPSDDYNYDDDEFEDYEEDFEEDEDESQNDEEKRRSRDEMEDVLRALDEENDRLMATSRRSDHSDSTELSDERFQSEPQPTIARSRTIINFVSAKQRQLSDKVSSKTRRRGNDLLKLIDLDSSGFDIFDLPPVGEYDLYIRSFGRSNTRQAYVQTNEDNIERDIQTEEIEYRDKWTQHPPEDFNGCGRGDDAIDETEEDASRRKNQTDTARLSRFLQRAAQVVAILLDEEYQSNSRGEVTGSRSSLSLSDGYVTLGSPEFLKGRHVQCSHFSPDQPNLLLTIHSRPEKIDKKNPLSRTGLICVWNSNEPSVPQKILACESQPVCCCFSPIKPSLVFAGTADGSVIAWDLQESMSMHKAVKIADQEYIPRFPTYNTAGVSSDETHLSSVTSIMPVISQKERVKANTVMNDSGSSLSFQLASLEESGILHLWVVAEIKTPDLSGSESDLGLSPGGKIKLLKSSSITIDNPLRNFQVKASIKVVDMILLPNDPNQFFVGTDLGFVIHGVRLGTVSYPKCYITETGSPVSVTSVDISPFNDPCLLVGCDDGSVRLHNLKLEYPPMIWPRVCDNGSVTCVRWSRSRPCVFFVLDDTSRIHVFDLIERDSSPVAIDAMSAGRIISMELTNDHVATGLGLPGRQPQILLSLDTGDTEIHTLTKQFTEQQTLEDEFIPSYIERF